MKENENVQMEYPQELILKCKQSRNQICRRKTAPKAVKDGEMGITLLEMEDPVPGEFYDIFEVMDFSFSKETQIGHFKAGISLLESCCYMEIEAHILDLKNTKMIAQVPVTRVENTNKLVVEQGFTLEQDVVEIEDMGVIAYGKWGNHLPEENELSIYKEANKQDSGVGYKHIYPKKEKEAVILGTLEDNVPKMGENGDSDHIVIALIRSPEETKDIDYICGMGRIEGKPSLCVPGQGTFIFPVGETVMDSEEYPNEAVCRLYRRNGGAAVIAGNDVAAYEMSKIEIIPQGNVCTYQFLSWSTPYTDEAGWKKTEFDYRLELKLNTVNGDNQWYTREFFIDTRDRENSITDEVLPLQIMYGCVAPETEIAMADGSRKKICEIRIGDRVLSRDGKMMEVDNVWKGPEYEQMVEIFVEGMPIPLFATKSHPIRVQEADGTEKWKQAGKCAVMDKVLVLDGTREYRSVVKIKEKDPCEVVYNLDLRSLDGEYKEGMMYCNGILTGDNRVQNSKLEG